MLRYTMYYPLLPFLKGLVLTSRHVDRSWNTVHLWENAADSRHFVAFFEKKGVEKGAASPDFLRYMWKPSVPLLKLSPLALLRRKTIVYLYFLHVKW